MILDFSNGTSLQLTNAKTDGVDFPIDVIGWKFHIAWTPADSEEAFLIDGMQAVDYRDLFGDKSPKHHP